LFSTGYSLAAAKQFAQRIADTGDMPFVDQLQGRRTRASITSESVFNVLVIDHKSIDRVVLRSPAMPLTPNQARLRSPC
jgi:hypothetical protein